MSHLVKLHYLIFYQTSTCVVDLKKSPHYFHLKTQHQHQPFFLAITFTDFIDLLSFLWYFYFIFTIDSRWFWSRWWFCLWPMVLSLTDGSICVDRWYWMFSSQSTTSGVSWSRRWASRSSRRTWPRATTRATRCARGSRSTSAQLARGRWWVQITWHNHRGRWCVQTTLHNHRWRRGIQLHKHEGRCVPFLLLGLSLSLWYH